jgi:hypothetical protein
MQVLTTVHRAHEGHSQPTQGKITYPARGPRMGVHHIDIVLTHQRP